MYIHAFRSMLESYVMFMVLITKHATCRLYPRSVCGTGEIEPENGLEERVLAIGFLISFSTQFQDPALHGVQSNRTNVGGLGLKVKIPRFRGRGLLWFRSAVGSRLRSGVPGHIFCTVRVGPILLLAPKLSEGCT